MKTLAMLAALGGLFALPAHATELLLNGGFENDTSGGALGYYDIGSQSGTNGGGPDYPVPADFGFTVSNGNVDIVANGQYGTVFVNGGAHSLDLVGFGSTGEISQTFGTTLGATYTVNLDYGANGGVQNPTADVLVNGVAIGSVTGAPTAQHFTATFLGTGSPTTFAVNETYGANSGGVFLDNVSVSAVPEPRSWMLMLGGLGLAGAALRSNRRSLLAI